jgi:hypothetical protein
MTDARSVGEGFLLFYNPESKVCGCSHDQYVTSLRRKRPNSQKRYYEKIITPGWDQSDAIFTKHETSLQELFSLINLHQKRFRVVSYTG